MKNQEWYDVDKTTWPVGPWQDEPDKIQWTDEATKLPCLIVRNGSGALCGYVGVDETHPYFQVPYDDADVAVHGGLTYAGLCQENGKVCHIVEDGENDKVWWLGFDCAHWNDFSPVVAQYITWDRNYTQYKDVQYVTNEVTNLAKQLSEVGND